MTASVRVAALPADPADPAGSELGDRLHTLLAAATRVDGAAPLDESALLQLRHRGTAGSTLLVAGEPVNGFAWLRGEMLDLVVDPAHRRRGIGGALLGEALARSAADRGSGIGRSSGAAGLTAWSHGGHPGAAVLAAATGFVRARDLWVMRRPLTGLPPLPDTSGGPLGIDVRSFRRGQDEEAFLALNAEAFAHHPEQGGMTRADLELRTAEAWFDPAGFFVAEAREDPERGLLGFHWTKVHPGDPRTGEVYVVGVSPRAQGSGLGRLLTLTGLHHLAGLGLSEVLLYVEADNTAARAVYDRLGFTHADADTHVMYHRP